MIDCKRLRPARPGSPVVIAVFSCRYDAHLVPDFIENIRPFVDGYVAWDDRAATSALTSEPDRRNRLLAGARQMGAHWILAADPDERIEASLSKRLPEMLALGETTLWTFAMREMFTPDSYRSDGIWGTKTRIVLFPAKAAEKTLDVALHGSWVRDQDSYKIRDAETNLYHLRMATPERRRLRRALYAAADPARQFQAIGYDYLDDDRGMVLETIPGGREFTPAFHEDGGLWSPDPARLGAVSPDPPAARLTLAAEALTKCGAAQASHVLQDLALADPGDADLLPMAAMLARTAGDLPRTQALATAILDRAPDNALALYLRSLAMIGDPASLADLARLQDLVGDCLLTRDLQSRMSRATEDFSQPGALWRRWVPGAATCHQGHRIAPAPMSVIVIGHRAPAELGPAVASLRAQDPPCEIVVVNSGGGPVESVLAEHLDHIRLISTDQPLYVGAARNIGIDASRGAVIGFLAADCQALPGWVAGRMKAHDLGAAWVSNPVVPEPGAGHLATASIGAQYLSRSPLTLPCHVSHFGRSHLRDGLSLAGYFPTGLRVSEDAALNRSLDRLAPSVWAPEVQTTHKEPRGLAGLIGDNYGRGRRMAAHAPFRFRPDRLSSRGQHWLTLCERYGLVRLTFADKRRFDLGMTPRWLAVSLTIAVAQFLGLLRGLARQARADRARQRAEAGLATGTPASTRRALVQARRAFTMDPQDPDKAVLLGKSLERLGQDGSAAFRAALALDPTQPEPLERLLARLIAQGDWPGALVTAEAAAEQAPQVAALWLIAAEAAAGADRKALAIAHAQRALSLSPDTPAAHARVDRLYQSLGNPGAAAHRRTMTDRLQAGPDGRKGLVDGSDPPAKGAGASPILPGSERVQHHADKRAADHRVDPVDQGQRRFAQREGIVHRHPGRDEEGPDAKARHRAAADAGDAGGSQKMPHHPRDQDHRDQADDKGQRA